MQIIDKIWGTWELKDPLLIELVHSKPIQRLKEISNDGANRYLFKVGNASRYEHSLGVLFLAQHFSQTREDYIMALLHDVAHTAFSHVVDFVFDVGDTQDIHEEVKKQVLQESEIKGILEKYGYSIEKFYKKDDFPIVGNGSSMLNVDRLDYFMRDGFGLNILPLQQIQLYLNDLKYNSVTSEFYFTDLSIAASFAFACLNTSVLQYLSANSVGSYYLLSSALKRAIEIGLITKSYLISSTDEEVMSLLRVSVDSEILKCISRLNYNTKFEFCNAHEAEFSTKNKVRYIDPVVINGDLVKVKCSEVISNFREMVSEVGERYGSVSVKIIRK